MSGTRLRCRPTPRRLPTGGAAGAGDAAAEASNHPIVFRPQLGVHQRAIRLGQRCRARRRHLLEFLAEMLDLVGMIACDLASERPLDLFGRRAGLDGKKLIEILHSVVRDLALLLELRHIGGRQFFPFPFFESLAGLARFGRASAVRAEVPSRLQRAPAVRAAAAQAASALRTRKEIDANRRAASRAERAHLAHFRDDSQQFLGGRLSALDLRQPVLAEADHAARERRVAQRLFRRPSTQSSGEACRSPASLRRALCGHDSQSGCTDRSRPPCRTAQPRPRPRKCSAHAAHRARACTDGGSSCTTGARDVAPRRR